MKKQQFHKKLTRDNSLIIQEVWDRGYAQDYYGNSNPFLPTQINYVVDGVVEIWDNIQAIKWFEDQIQKKYKEDPLYFSSVMKEYKKIASKTGLYRKKDRFDSLEELEIFIDLLQKGTYGFLLFYHSAGDDRTPPEIRKEALKIRDEDKFYDNADRLIKATLEHFFIYTQGKSISILSHEIYQPPDQEELGERFQNSIYVVGNSVQIKTLQEFANTNQQFEYIFDEIPENNVLKGQIGYPGFAKGHVKILKRKDQLEKCEEGDILIAPETTPDFLTAMKRAVAIVTDEGGILCHAAIVARELKKPCVIGTKVATKFFKDGELVEVDAENGIVRKL